MSEWVYNGVPVSDDNVPESAFGFVYEITDRETGRSYIGKKFLTKAGTRQVKGKKVKTRKPSDWKTYWGSCKELVDLVAEKGEDKFTREILEYCNARGITNYREAKWQFDRNVLEAKLPNGQWKYFNGIINIRISRKAAGIR